MPSLSSEETPLLSEPNGKHGPVYDRFSNERKRVILFLVSCCGLLQLFVAGTFLPSIPQIAKDLESTGPVVTLAVSGSVLAASVGALFGASYSTFYGRRPVFLVTLPLLCIGSFGTALAADIPQLMLWRVVQAFGASPGISVGAGVIGDLYKLEERGRAMGLFFAAVLLGPSLAPPIGGFAAHYASWRIMQAILGIFGLVLFVSVLSFFPETSLPGARGIDKLRLTSAATNATSRSVVFINPFKSLWLLRSPNFMAVCLAGTTVLLSYYVLMVPLAYTIGAKYGISNEAVIGAFFLPQGLGGMVAGPLAGKMSDKMVIHWKERRGGVWYPEDRLRAAIPGALLLVPLSMIFSGLLIAFVPGKIGLILNLICLFCNGLGVDMTLGPSTAYGVDIFHDRSAESMAASAGLRSFLISFAVTGILPIINTLGIVFVHTISALLAWTGCLILLLTIRYGTQMRAWIDMDYSTADNN